MNAWVFSLFASRLSFSCQARSFLRTCKDLFILITSYVKKRVHMSGLAKAFNNLWFRILIHIICLALVIVGLIVTMFSLIIIGIAVEIVFLILVFLFSRYTAKEKPPVDMTH